MPRKIRNLLTLLKAAADPTRLRLLALLAPGELTVGEITQILKQSQPRVSRHLKLLCDAGLLERYKEAHSVYYRLASQDDPLLRLHEGLDAADAELRKDRERRDVVIAERARRATDAPRGTHDGGRSARLAQRHRGWRARRRARRPSPSATCSMSAPVPASC
jgi:DNA-binding transcriptional ArsR family regulator